MARRSSTTITECDASRLPSERGSERWKYTSLGQELADHREYHADDAGYPPGSAYLQEPTSRGKRPFPPDRIPAGRPGGRPHYGKHFTSECLSRPGFLVDTKESVRVATCLPLPAWRGVRGLFVSRQFCDGPAASQASCCADGPTRAICTAVLFFARLSVLVKRRQAHFFLLRCQWRSR